MLKNTVKKRKKKPKKPSIFSWDKGESADPQKIKRDIENFRHEVELGKIHRQTSLSYSAEQFILRFPKEIVELFKLDKDKKYKFTFKIDSDKKKERIGGFEINEV